MTNIFNETITLTFCESGENHVGMEMLGNKASPGEGFNLQDLETIKSFLDEKEYSSELYNLNNLIDEEKVEVDPAHILVIREGVKYFNIDSNELIKELTSFEWDRKYWDSRRKRVLNKHARSNVCFGTTSREPDYENKKGRIVGFMDVPIVNQISDGLSNLLGDKGANMVCEGNRYFDLKKCGIGFHGDSERRRGVGVRVGQPMIIKWSWFHQSKHEGDPLELTLNDGDIYLMSEKSVGTDWKRRNIYTLRHAAGSKKYEQFKK